MKKIKIWLVLCLCLYAESSFAKNEDTIPINEQTFLVYRRYYFVARLDKTIKLLAKMYNEVNAMQAMIAGRKINFDLILPTSSHGFFEHKQILRSIKRIVQTRSLKPLFMVWDSFTSYKSLQDDLLVEDFSKEIFIITRNTIDYVHECKGVKKAPLKYKDEQVCKKFNLQERIEVISMMTDQLECLLCDKPIKEVALRIEEMDDLKLRIHTDEVAFRLYCLHRLDSAIQYLLTSSEQDLSADQVRAIDPPVFWWHKRGEGKTLHQLWDDLNQYKYIDNELFVRDVSMYVFLLLKNQQEKQRAFKSLSHNDVLTIHSQIEQLPLEDILNAIDVIVEQMGTVVDHYQKSGLTLSQWVKKYWWVPPLVFSSILFKFVTFYYKNIANKAA
ncbi:MAG: hypothetical protein WD055_05935 [Candidatus Dependentiae bacterium]